MPECLKCYNALCSTRPAHGGCRDKPYLVIFTLTLVKPPLSTSAIRNGLSSRLAPYPLRFSYPLMISAPSSATSCLHHYRAILSLHRKPRTHLLLDGLSKLIPNPMGPRNPPRPLLKVGPKPPYVRKPDVSSPSKGLSGGFLFTKSITPPLRSWDCCTHTVA